MKRHSDLSPPSVDDLIGLGGQSARKSYYPVLQSKLEELEAERNRYKWLFENALHGIFQAGTAGEIRRANPTLARVCGYANPAQLEQGACLVDLLGGGQREFERLRERLLSEGQVFLHESTLRRADGRLVEVSMNLLLRTEPEGAMIEGFVADITERKRMELQILRTNEVLEQRVSERTAELVELNARLQLEIEEREAAQRAMAQAKEQAENANRSKDKYLAAASHDLLQPLNAARLLVSALRERQLADGEQDLVERVHLALSGAEHLLSDLLDIARLDQNAVQPDLQVFPARHLLRNLEAEFQPVAAEAGLQLRVRGSDLFIHSDLRLLTRIVRNLVANAIRYTERGGVLLALRRQGGQVRIEVWDTGVGIPEDKRREIFIEFRQLSGRVRSRGGVGLGLAIVERIARVLELPVGLQSRPGFGSCFSITVPLAAAPQQMIPLRPVGYDADLLAGAEVLVVDNEPDILVSMDALLGGWGCRITTATDLRTCLSAESPIPDLILADYHLDDGEYGTDLVAALRAHHGRQIPAAILTADRSDATRRRFRQAGLAVLNKPLKPGKLRALMSHLLESAARVAVE